MQEHFQAYTHTENTTANKMQRSPQDRHLHYDNMESFKIFIDSARIDSSTVKTDMVKVTNKKVQHKYGRKV